MKSFLKLVWIPLIFLLLAGCSPLVAQAQDAAGQAPLLISGSQAAGQTFTAHQDGLQGVEVFLQPSQPGSGQVTLRLYDPPVGAPFSGPLLAQASIPLASVTQPGWYRFDFDARPNSNMQDYAFSLQVTGDGQVGVGNAPGNSYQEGSAYLGAAPAGDAQLAFRTVYRARYLVLGLLHEILTWLGWLALALFAFVLPGWALLSGLWAGWETHAWGVRLGLATGLSLAIYPILLLWTDLAGLHLGAAYAWAPGLAAIVFLVWKNRRGLLHFLAHPAIGWPDRSRREWAFSWLHAAVFAAVMALVFGIRFYAVRTLSLPMWGDSYQHTLIAQLIVDNRGLFQSWQPYAALQTLSYHYGFHTAVAVFHWLTNLDVAQSMIWFGQILNGLAVLALYPLAVRVSGGRRWAGIGAMLVAGLLSPMPMFYTNWGRYTQLAGQTILPAAVCLGWAVLENLSFKADPGNQPGARPPGRMRRAGRLFVGDWRSLVVASLAMAGLALTHYRILIFGVLFFPVLLAFELRKTNWKPLLARLSALTLLSGLLVLPWYLRSYGSAILKTLASFMSTPAASMSPVAVETDALGPLNAYYPVLLWLAFLLAIAIVLWKNNRKAALFSAWWFLALLATNPEWLRLPGAGVITNFALVIAVYIPAGVLIGTAAVTLFGPARFPERWKLAGAAVLCLAAVGLGLWGANQRRKDISNSGALAVRPDMRAGAWIQANTPPEAGFLVNSFFAYAGSSIVGSDGGWWLPYLARRQTNLPPLTYAAERGPIPDYRQWVNALTTLINNKGVSDPAVLAELKARGLTYIYVGQQQGRVNYSGPLALDPLKLSQEPGFQTVYHQDRVWIFKILP